MPDEDSLRHKYTPLPDEPRYRKRKRKLHVKSDHRHEYEEVCINAHGITFFHGEHLPYFYIATRCKVCGRLGDVRVRSDIHEPPEGMPLYDVGDYSYFFDHKTLPSERRVL